MPIFGHNTTQVDQTDTGVDANATSTTTALTLDDATTVAIFVKGASGTHATHVITMQISPNGTDWYDTAHTITGTGDLHNILCVAEEVRGKVTTNEGGTSTVDITFLAK